MPRTKRGWIGEYDPLKLSVIRNHGRTGRVIVGLAHENGMRIALDLGPKAASLLALLGRTEESDDEVFSRSELEVDGKIYVADECPRGEATCDENLAAWEGREVSLRMEFDPGPRSIVWAVRDPVGAKGFTIKLPTTARNAVFAMFHRPDDGRTPELAGSCRVEGRMEVAT